MQIKCLISPFSVHQTPSTRRHRWGGRRRFAVLVLLIGVCWGLVELGGLTPTGTYGHAAAASFSEAPAALPTESFSSFPWNLDDDGQPLVSLPDHLRGNLDLSLTYSMGQFQFPLFQSLYFNQRVGKYILMVIPNEGGRAQFIDLEPVAGWTRFEARDDSGLRLVDNGSVKSLSTREGTIYTFATFADGELHCSQINEADGLTINLKYTNDSTIETISDSAGRLIRFSYTGKYLSGVTQIWSGGAGKLTRTWAIDNRHSGATAPNRGEVGPRESKHIPSNAIHPAYTSQMAESDSVLARIFGGNGAVAAANSFEPSELGRQYPLYRGDLIGDDGIVRRGHLSYAMHLYGSKDGTGAMELYVPAGFLFNSNEPTPTDAVVTFYYPKLGSLTNVTLAVFHVANFQLSYEGERVRIGNLGGPGGSVASYKHSHLEFYRGDTGLPPANLRAQMRIDPTTVFASKTERSLRFRETSARR